jgi:hypothetical protein
MPVLIGKRHFSLGEQGYLSGKILCWESQLLN